MSAVRGSRVRLGALAKRLSALHGDGSKQLEIKIAAEAAPQLTMMMDENYSSGRTVYGAPRPLGVDGHMLDLVDSGRTRSEMVFVSDGTSKIRVTLTQKYQKYLIGKYAILPSGVASLPGRWLERLGSLALDVLGRSMDGEA